MYSFLLKRDIIFHQTVRIQSEGNITPDWLKEFSLQLNEILETYQSEAVKLIKRGKERLDAERIVLIAQHLQKRAAVYGNAFSHNN